MKANAKPEFNKKWWTSEKPADIKGADLEKALTNVEKALAEEKKKKGDAQTLEAAIAALAELEPLSSLGILSGLIFSMALTAALLNYGYSLQVGRLVHLELVPTLRQATPEPVALEST